MLHLQHFVNDLGALQHRSRELDESLKRLPETARSSVLARDLIATVNQRKQNISLLYDAMYSFVISSAYEYELRVF